MVRPKRIKDCMSYNMLSHRGLANFFWTVKMNLKGTRVCWSGVFKSIWLDTVQRQINECGPSCWFCKGAK